MGLVEREKGKGELKNRLKQVLYIHQLELQININWLYSDYSNIVNSNSNYFLSSLSNC